MVADGRMQDRDNEQDVSSPTVSTESLFLLAAESRRVITVDIEGDFLHSVMTNVIYMEISGQCVDVLIYMYGDIYFKNLYNNKIYVKLDRALYGTIEAAKVWYDTLSSYLTRLGFRANAHDQCILSQQYGWKESESDDDPHPRRWSDDSKNGSVMYMTKRMYVMIKL